MATYILFWNPEISSYTKERFLEDFENCECVGNWSFNEYEGVKPEDTFYMMRCGGGNTGIVMRGEILTECYKDEDWSPKGRPNIHYADISDCVTINSWTDAPLLTPEILTKLLPDFNWHGGHSGRRLSDDYARQLDMIWLEYINSNPGMFYNNDAVYHDWATNFLSDEMEEALRKQLPCECEVCGYSYRKTFGHHMEEENVVYSLPSRRLTTLFHMICRACEYAGADNIEEALSKSASSDASSIG